MLFKNDLLFSFFNNHPDIVEAIKTTPLVAPNVGKKQSGTWADLTEDDLLGTQKNNYYSCIFCR